MVLLGIELTTDNVIALFAWLVSPPAVLIWLIRQRDLRINKLYGYYEKHKKLKNSLKEHQDSFQLNIAVEMLESIEKDVTKVGSAKHRKVFLYILNNNTGMVLNKFNLKNLLEYIYLDEVFKIHFDKFYLKQNSYKLLFLMSLLGFMLFTYFFYNSVIHDVLFFKITSMAFVIVFEFLMMFFYDKLIFKQKITKYNDALAEIDASAFKPD